MTDPRYSDLKELSGGILEILDYAFINNLRIDYKILLAYMMYLASEQSLTIFQRLHLIRLAKYHMIMNAIVNGEVNESIEETVKNMVHETIILHQTM